MFNEVLRIFFVSSVLFTQQERFGKDGIINIHNQDQRPEENPHGVIDSRNKQQFRINVRAGIVNDCLVGPHVFPRRLTGNHYRDFLLHDLLKLLEDVPLARTSYMLRHILAMLCEMLAINTYHDRCAVEEVLLHGLHARRFEFSGFLLVGTLKNPNICSSC
jgi:hypothetical protein